MSKTNDVETVPVERLVIWIREQASGPMTENEEHANTCNMLAKCANELERLQAEIARLLDAAEFSEGALFDHIGREDGLDAETARRVALMCSDLIVKHGRVSVMVESSKQPAT